MKFIIQKQFMLSECTVLVHRPGLQYNCNTDYQGVTFQVSTVRETDSPPIYLNRRFMNNV